MINFVLALYSLAWRVTIPFLKRSPRVGLGWQQRILADAPEGPFDLWIQAASGGESMLTNRVLQSLNELLPKNNKLRVLATSGTQQGIDSLIKGCKSQPTDSFLDITVAFFPFDAPYLMKKAFSQFAPKLAVVVETELWPGYLTSAKLNNIKVLVINGRMSAKSFRSYKYFSNFFKKYGPDKVLAISPTDGERFSRIVGQDRVDLINNIKFDLVQSRLDLPEHNPIIDILPENGLFLLLGSIRRQEEKKILNSIIAILRTRPNVTIGLFPKHIERADHWIQLLKNENISASKRSTTFIRQTPGSVIVWDVFGELAGAYALAGAAFVGGSLENLGGQNFLEPLVFGLRPVIGPHWSNFAWIGREIVASGLVKEVADENELVTELFAELDEDVSKDQVSKQVQDFLLPRKGGTNQVCQQIIDILNGVGNT